MTTEEHKERHKRLHESLDELFADFIGHHPNEHNLTEQPIIRLLKWSAEQTQSPSPTPDR